MAESAMLTGPTRKRWTGPTRARIRGGPPAERCQPERGLLAAIRVNKGSALSGLGGREAEAETLLLEGLDGAEAAQDYQSALRAINNLAHLVFRRWPVDQAWDLSNAWAG